MNAYFDFYGFTIRVSSDTVGLVEEIRRHFGYFSAPGGTEEIHLEMRFAPAPYKQLPPLPAAFITPRNVCFQQAGVSYIDYFGRGLAIYDGRRVFFGSTLWV